MKKEQEITVAVMLSGQYMISSSSGHFTSFSDLQAFNSAPVQPTEEVYTENARFTDFHDPNRRRGQKAEVDEALEQSIQKTVGKDAEVLDILKHMPQNHTKRIELNNALTEINDKVTWDEAITKATPGELDEKRAEKTKEVLNEFVKGYHKNFREYL